MIELLVNGRRVEVSVAPDTPLLWVLREQLGLTGTKFGCGAGHCGACSVHLDGLRVQSCQIPVAAAVGFEITTIEGLARDPQHPVLRAWLEEQVAQCGYCQSGQIMTAAALLEQSPQPTDEEIGRGMDGNLCRCGTYPRVRRAIRRAAELRNAK
jgi:isoquinoline 1-oxidoreductase alpha subunit